MAFIEKEHEKQFYFPKIMKIIVQKDAGLDCELNKLDVVLSQEETPFHIELM